MRMPTADSRNWRDIALWPPFMSAMHIVADVSTGLMLFSLGVRLNTAPFAQWRIGIVGAIATPLTIGGAQLHVCRALRSGARKGRLDRHPRQPCALFSISAALALRLAN